MDHLVLYMIFVPIETNFNIDAFTQVSIQPHFIVRRMFRAPYSHLYPQLFLWCNLNINLVVIFRSIKFVFG